MDYPTDKHYAATGRILRYLKKSHGQGLFFPASNDLKLKAFADSDWATCSDSRKSIIGFCTFLGNSLISWKTEKQATVSKSSTEAEYRALANVACEIQWLSYLLQKQQIDDFFTKPLPTAQFHNFINKMDCIQFFLKRRRKGGHPRYARAEKEEVVAAAASRGQRRRVKGRGGEFVRWILMLMMGVNGRKEEEKLGF
ncbi:uncharacterized mitochondrial protein AtMg00810-like [Mercurialis annua]|uniref:uncharacterized mitochondrial protein AtMg00810-like n=1 Tax=Mercurialis annua TaxID=3986 RepID=UPI002160F8EE|nr:uncharacterized mitochondrial protein AtMg00810-like [Mercurialis annua]